MNLELFAVVVLSLVLGVVLFSYERAIRQILRLKREKSEVEKEARLKAIKLVRDAREKAIEIIGDAKVDSVRWQEVLDEEISKLTDEQLINYKEKLQNISKDIEKDVKSGAEDFRKVLELETVGAEKAVAKRVQDEFTEIEKELEAYRTEKLSDIDKKAEVLLEKITKEVFGKSMKSKDQEQLIIEALDEAKKEHAI
jgi:hypothetical protein